jgi:cell division septal protein FtsQ
MLMVAAIVVLITLATRWASREPFRGVRIEGRVVLDSAEVMEGTAIPVGSSLRQLDLGSIEARIAAHPYIEQAAAYRGENGMLVVKIRERVPVAMTFISQSPLYLDSQGVSLPFRFSTATSDVPIVTGIDSVMSSNRLAGVARSKAQEALAVVRSVRETDPLLYRQISEFHRQNNGEYELIMADGATRVLCGTPEALPGHLPKLDSFLRHVLSRRSSASADYVDLRWKGEIVVRWKNDSTAVTPSVKPA